MNREEESDLDLWRWFTEVVVETFNKLIVNEINLMKGKSFKQYWFCRILFFWATGNLQKKNYNDQRFFLKKKLFIV